MGMSKSDETYDVVKTKVNSSFDHRLATSVRISIGYVHRRVGDEPTLCCE
jgi:hypothetical protein